MQKLDVHLKVKKEMLNTSLKYLYKSNEYLTEDEIKVMVNITKLLGSMCMGIDRQICLDIVNALIRTRVDEKDFKFVTKSIVQRMLRNNEEIIKLVYGTAIDPAQICQADAEVRDCEFVKLELYMKLLYDMGKIPWKTYSKIPRLNIYNMDEVATNTYAHRRKIIDRCG